MPSSPLEALQPVTLSLSETVRIHAVQTGYVAVKEAHRTLTGPAWSSMATIALDPRWTEWLPIYAWVIEHPESVVVIDTGETGRVAEPDYFDCDPGSAFVYNRLLRFDVAAGDEIGPQLRRLGIPPEGVGRVICTHLHSDHGGGLSHFPNAEILVARREYEAAQRQPRGALPCRWPSWFAPRLVEYVPEPAGAFDHSYPVTQAGDLFIVPTPGHSAGHQSVIFRHEDTSYFFAGDASFSEAQLQQDIVAGICADMPAARQTMRQIQEQIQSFPTVYLPSHDAESGRRLAARQTTMLKS